MTYDPFHSRTDEHDLAPDRDWGILIVAMMVLLILSAAWSIELYLMIARGQPFGTSVGEAPALDLHAIDAAQQTFAARAAEESKYQTEYHFVDPSQE